jgi:phospholipase C
MMLRAKFGRVPCTAFVVLALLWTVAGCSARSSAPGGLLPVATMPAAGNPVGQHIKHVIVIIQENRSFENFFAGYPGADAPMWGWAGTKKVKLHPITFIGPDIEHDWHSSMREWDHGKMDGFYQLGNPQLWGPDPAYAYVERSLIKPYWIMARDYVLVDHMFPTEFGGSFTAHLTLVAGTDNLKPKLAEVDFPDGEYDDCDSPAGSKSSTINDNRYEDFYSGPFPCFNQFNTMAETLDAANVSWKFYATKLLDAGFWEPFEAIKYVRYGSDWDKNIIAPQSRVLTDPGQGKLASVSWVTPTAQDSDHPAHRSSLGPSWVASVVNAIGESKYWKSSAIIILWDDWGGWYDNAPPPQLDFRGLGLRVPCLIVSPYAKHGYIADKQYEYGSILKFIEQAFDLPALGPTDEGYTDTRARSLDDAFDFTQKPRAFKPLPSLVGPSHFLHESAAAEAEPVDTE